MRAAFEGFAMRIALAWGFALFPFVATAFEPGSLGSDYRDSGYVQGCSDAGELPGCTLIAGGSQFVVAADGPTPPEVMERLRALPKLAWVDFRGDMLEVYDSYATLALGFVAEAAQADPDAALVQGMQGDWVSEDDALAAVSVDGMIWTDVYDGAEVARSVVHIGEDCADGTDNTLVVELFAIGSAEAVSLCFAVTAVTADRMELVYLARGNALVYRRP